MWGVERVPAAPSWEEQCSPGPGRPKASGSEDAAPAHTLRALSRGIDHSSLTYNQSNQAACWALTQVSTAACTAAP